MTHTVSVSEVEKDFRAYHDQALGEPVRVMKYRRKTVYIVSAKTFHERRQAQRDAIVSVELADAELAVIETAEVPTEHRYSLGK